MGANFGMVGMDWQQRINWDRLRKYRLERARKPCADCHRIFWRIAAEKFVAWRRFRSLVCLVLTHGGAGHLFVCMPNNKAE